jgi:hypothetical protein
MIITDGAARFKLWHVVAATGQGNAAAEEVPSPCRLIWDIDVR